VSGVADPKAIKNNWKLAPTPIRQIANIEKIVTLVDCQTFGTDFMTFDMVQNRDGWANPNDVCGGNAKVSELLVDQVEAADLILLNKCDLATPDQVQLAAKVASSLNQNSRLEEVSFGRISPTDILGLKPKDATDHGPVSSDNSQETSHEHDHSHSCNDPDCTDHSHNHSHAHSCDDPNCEDSSHSHSHSHSHATSTDNLGITNFVYKADRPFHSQRLLSLLNRWPVPKKDLLDVDFVKEVREGGNVDVFGKSLDDNPFLGVLRSKGFTWLAPTQWSGIMEDAWRHDTAMYMSHAGRHMSIDTAGRWWAAISSEQMDAFFAGDLVKEKERIIREDFVTEEFGDRRQELVFIGVEINQKRICEELDACLLTDEEMETYRTELENFRRTLVAQ
jgi:G3E family GTPase